MRELMARIGLLLHAVLATDAAQNTYLVKDSNTTILRSRSHAQRARVRFASVNICTTLTHGSWCLKVGILSSIYGIDCFGLQLLGKGYAGC